MEGFAMPLSYKVRLGFIRNFNARELVRGVPMRARENMVKVSVPARFALGLKGKWHTVGNVLDKINNYQDLHNIQDYKINILSADQILLAVTLASISGSISIYNYPGIFKKLTLIITGLTTAIFVGKHIASLFGYTLVRFGKKDLDFYDYLLDMNNKVRVEPK